MNTEKMEYICQSYLKKDKHYELQGGMRNVVYLADFIIVVG